MNISYSNFNCMTCHTVMSAVVSCSMMASHTRRCTVSFKLFPSTSEVTLARPWFAGILESSAVVDTGINGWAESSAVGLLASGIGAAMFPLVPRNKNNRKYFQKESQFYSVSYVEYAKFVYNF